MANAKRDDNRVPSLIGVSYIDDITPVVVGADPVSRSLLVLDQVANSLVPSSFDYISISYTGSNLTGVVYKSGGSGGTTISTLTLGYDGSNNLTSITKS